MSSYSRHYTEKWLYELRFWVKVFDLAIGTNLFSLNTTELVYGKHKENDWEKFFSSEQSSQHGQDRSIYFIWQHISQDMYRVSVYHWF